MARDGIEPPTPAFSGLKNQSLTDRFVVVSWTYGEAIWTPFGLQGAASASLDSGGLQDFMPVDSTWTPAFAPDAIGTRPACAHARGRHRLLRFSVARRNSKSPTCMAGWRRGRHGSAGRPAHRPRHPVFGRVHSGMPGRADECGRDRGDVRSYVARGRAGDSAVRRHRSVRADGLKLAASACQPALR